LSSMGAGYWNPGKLIRNASIMRGCAGETGYYHTCL
jgi:hypothetical protein